MNASLNQPHTQPYYYHRHSLIVSLTYIFIEHLHQNLHKYPHPKRCQGPSNFKKYTKPHNPQPKSSTLGAKSFFQLPTYGDTSGRRNQVFKSLLPYAGTNQALVIACKYA